MMIAKKQNVVTSQFAQYNGIPICNVFAPIFMSFICCTSVYASLNEDSDDKDFFQQWSATVKQAKEEQPHWITPLATVTPRLEQEFRYDQSWQSKPNSVDVNNYGGSKGLELIPTENTEVIVGIPPYFVKDTTKGTDSGWGDESVTVKYRVLSANEEQGNYIVTGFIGVSSPTGSDSFSNHATIVTPTIAAGKGWGTRETGFDIQSTLGIGIPDTNRNTVGVPVNWSTALQWHALRLFWPEVELNYTHWRAGPDDGKTQTAITTGVILGRFALSQTVNLIAGVGYQQPLTSFRTYEHTWLSTARITF